MARPANAIPAMAPARPIKAPSTINWRMTRNLVAPSAKRMASSGWRAVARTSERLATLAQAVRNTSAAMPNSSQSGSSYWVRSGEMPLPAGRTENCNFRNSFAPSAL